MTLTLIKIHKGQEVDSIKQSFNDIDDYIKYLNDLGLQIDDEAAMFDIQQPSVVYRIPLLSTEIN